MAWNNYKPKVTLPIHHHQDDAKWIESTLLGIEPKHRTTACVGYNKVFTEAHEAEDLPHKKDGAARVAANNRLREFAKKTAPVIQQNFNNFNISDL